MESINCWAALADVDKFLHEHRDFTLLFAAGNTGVDGWLTVAKPGLAKVPSDVLTVPIVLIVLTLRSAVLLRTQNVLAVGSCMNDPLSFVELGKHDAGIEFTAPQRTLPSTPRSQR